MPNPAVRKICEKLPNGPPPIMRIFSDLGAHNLSVHTKSKTQAVKLVLKRAPHARVHPVSQNCLDQLKDRLQQSCAEMRDYIILPKHFLKLDSLIIFKTAEDWQSFCKAFRRGLKKQKQKEGAADDTNAEKLMEQDAKTKLGSFGYAPLKKVSEKNASDEVLFDIRRYNDFVQCFYEQVENNHSVWVFNPERWDNISHNICASDHYHFSKTPKDTVKSTIQLVSQMDKSLTKEGISTTNSYYVNWEGSLGPWIHAYMQGSTIAELAGEICEAEQIVI